ncbi:GNAT family N-acetyltransferase [Allorhizobium taibaishanense]|uniref:GNAT family N-acetyltransferase n=1 Tax=Allorhizobium taibaishanense TaxID=887144 RepID=A0A1Q9A215_9HYPH|nr:GNAT family N-acetyltransferase [Allorhizobium taibaishanense]MBB4009111.1 GNAT superfamily N-acetyltransferase [Allorhizobium taibaishanense]OLP48596.1 GNAT family N-acetyltransferase [Allorhizobium taibaishanense]
MADNLVIRPIVADDEAEWRRLWRAYLAFYETELPEEIYATTFARLISGGAGEFRGFLALVNGKPVGLSHYVFHRSCWYLTDVCYLQDLYVDPEIRASGVGRALISAVKAAAEEAGAGKVYWMTQEFNATARRLYDKVADKTPFIIYQQPL